MSVTDIHRLICYPDTHGRAPIRFLLYICVYRWDNILLLIPVHGHKKNSRFTFAPAVMTLHDWHKFERKTGINRTNGLTLSTHLLGTRVLRQET